MANTNQAIGEAEKALASMLLEAGAPPDEIALRAAPGPAGTVVVYATRLRRGGGNDVHVDPAWIRTAVVEPASTSDPSAQAHVYGEGFARHFSDLVRDRGWLQAPPSPSLLVQLLSPMRFRGLLEVDPDHAPTVSEVLEGMVLRFVRRLPDGGREWVRVHAGAEGPEQLSFDAWQG